MLKRWRVLVNLINEYISEVENKSDVRDENYSLDVYVAILDKTLFLLDVRTEMLGDFAVILYF